MNNSKIKKKFSDIYGTVFLLLIIALITTIFMLIRTDVVTNSVLKKENLPFLLIISDDNGPLLTEAILYNATTHRLALIDIPYEAGDLLPELKRSDRYSVFYQQGNKTRYRASIENLLDLAFLFTLDLHVEQLIKLVDLLEGIRLYLFRPINRIHPISQKRYIYNAGEQFLDGDQSKNFLYTNAGTVDYREYLENRENISEKDNLGESQEDTEATSSLDSQTERSHSKKKDIVLRQRNLRYARELLLGIVSTLQRYSAEKEDYIRLIYRYFQTDLSQRSFRKLLLYMIEMKPESTEVIFQDYLGRARMVQGKQINFPVYDGQVMRSQVVRILNQLHTFEDIIAREYPVRVEVLNGTNVVGLASRTGALYRQKGLDVVSIGNAERSDYDKTVVINLHSNSSKDIQRVANIIDAENIILQPLPGSEQTEAEVRVVLGRDFDGQRVTK